MSLFPLDRVVRQVVANGSFTLIDGKGARETFTGASPGPQVTVRLVNPRYKWQVALNPELKLGEGYMNGDFVIEEGTLRDLLTVVLGSKPPTDAVSRARYALRRSVAVVKDWNGLVRSSRNVRHHYDIDHELYELFLDRDMQYSCAYWRDGVTSLDQAQLDKRRHIGRKLLLQPGMHVLDIGSGWGGLGIHLAKEHGVRVTGVTLSTDQHATSVRRAKEAGLADRVEFKLMDYRNVEGAFDRIVSVGMFEHVGPRHFNRFFADIDRLLKPDGVALLHTIARNGVAAGINSWLGKYIFPGSYLPSLSQLAPIIERRNMWLTDVEGLRLHYAKTLRAWEQRFQAHRAAIAEKFDERFCRMWEFYLQSCEMGFRHAGLFVLQLQISKAFDAVPITREYLYDPPLPAADTAALAAAPETSRPERTAVSAAEAEMGDPATPAQPKAIRSPRPARVALEAVPAPPKPAPRRRKSAPKGGAPNQPS